MSLFPAYARDSSENRAEYEDGVDATGTESESLALEAQLLASDNDDEREAASSADAVSAVPETEHRDYYFDRKFDFGNLRVSTLYYPGRPQYSAAAVSLGPRAPARRAAPRYFRGAAPPAADAAAELAQRTRAFRDLLAERPDEDLWLRFIDFQERWSGAEAALGAAGEAAARLPAARRVRAALHRARFRALPPARLLLLLQDDLRAAAAATGAVGGGALLTELWLRALGVAGAAGAAPLGEAACAALSATRAHAPAYPHVLYVYGAWLRGAGLWERLVLLLELAATMNFPPTAEFPPPEDAAQSEQRELSLQHFEDTAISSGLPLSTVWVRVERARAAAHWRAPPPDAPAPLDPQRAPQPADVAELLLPAGAGAAALLLVQALRLAKVPLLPCSQYALAAVDASNDALGDAAEADGGEALLALLRAARRLPPAHPARAPPSAAARLLALLLDPPHYFSDAAGAGYLRWVTALWDACCQWAPPDARVALLCWRLRWLHALLLLLDPAEEAGRMEARRVRAEARAVLKRFAGASPLPYAQWARVELAAGEAAAARRAALHALRAALRDPTCASHQRLYVARVLSEVCDDEPSGAWATACAALGRELPDHDLREPPPRELLRAAQLRCEARCDALEREHGAESGEGVGSAEGVVAALLPAEAEWAAARVRLAAPARRAELVRAVRGAQWAPGGAAARYWEQSACALVTAAARDHRLAQDARALAPLFPHNALLALACSGAPLWAWDAHATQEERLRALGGAARSHRAALAGALPALLRAECGAWGPREAARAAAACARAAAGGAGGALLHAARLHAEARAARPRADAALYAALDALPHHKWLAVRGAASCGAQAAALADVLLERQLRAHTLLDELAPARSD